MEARRKVADALAQNVKTVFVRSAHSGDPRVAKSGLIVLRDLATGLS